LETLVQRVGFRQVEIRGNRMFVNNRPVKLRGVNHHETYPLTGRSVPAGLHRRDVELFREANVNLLRTCHYPPDEALMAAADELGMFIECEAPFCWVPVPFLRTPEGQRQQRLILQETAETVLTYRNHPSCCSGRWPTKASGERISPRLRTRPPPRSLASPDLQQPRRSSLHGNRQLALSGTRRTGKGTRRRRASRYLGEDCHINAYNRLELATDSALRDTWGRYLREMWDDIYASEGCLGHPSGPESTTRFISRTIRRSAMEHGA
jgi:hypothetical protein